MPDWIPRLRDALAVADYTFAGVSDLLGPTAHAALGRNETTPGLRRTTGGSPLGWPIWWLGVALGVLTLVPALPSRRLTLPLTSSSLLYGFGYLVFSVAAEMRYHLWTMIAALLAAVLVASDLVAGTRVARSRILLAAAPAVGVALACAAARLG